MDNIVVPYKDFSIFNHAVNNLKNSSSWINGELSYNIISNNKKNSAIIVAMHKGTEFESFQSENNQTLVVLQGKLKFMFRNCTNIIETGTRIRISENAFYLIESLEESIFLLVTSNNNIINKNNWTC